MRLEGLGWEEGWLITWAWDTHGNHAHLGLCCRWGWPNWWGLEYTIRGGKYWKEEEKMINKLYLRPLNHLRCVDSSTDTLLPTYPHTSIGWVSEIFSFVISAIIRTLQEVWLLFNRLGGGHINGECRALVKHCLSKRKITYAGQLLDFPSRNQAGIFATGEIRENFNFAAFWCVFLTKTRSFLRMHPLTWLIGHP